MSEWHDGFRCGWDRAMDAVMAEVRTMPPSKIGEAAFIKRIFGLMAKDGLQEKTN